MSGISRQTCAKCSKALGHAVCSGCVQCFCTKHYIEHRQDTAKRMDEEVVDILNHLRNRLINNKDDQYPLISEIDAWEKRSIEQIQTWAEQARNNIRQHVITNANDFEDSLRQMYEEIRVRRETEDYTEIEIERWLKELQKLKNMLENSSAIQLHVPEEAQTSIRPIQMKFLVVNRLRPTLDVHAKWKRNGVIVAGGNLPGEGNNQLDYPYGFDIDDDGTLFVADYKNNRIVTWKVGAKSGKVIIGGQGYGDGTNQLNRPTNVIIDRKNASLILSEWGNQRVTRWPLKNPQHGHILVSDVYSYGMALDDSGALYVCDWGRHEVRRYSSGDKKGIIVADTDGSLYVSDYNNHRVMKWMKDAEEGVVVAGSHVQGNDLRCLSGPTGLFVDEMGSVYVSEDRNHRITRWLQDAKSCHVIVGGEGLDAQLNSPYILRFDLKGNLHVADYSRRIQKFEIE